MTTRPGYIWSGTEWVSIGQEAVVAPVSYQASAPSTPSTGDIWIDSNDDVPGIDTSQFLRWRKTAVGGETSVSGTDDNGLTLQYTANYEQVYLNGVLLVRGQDYTATNGTSITGLTALAANDVVEVFGVVARVVGDVYTQAQTNSLLDAKSNVSSTGLVLLSSTTIGSAVSSITINNAFNSSYANYKVVITGGALSNTAYNSNNIYMKMHDGTNPSNASYATQLVRVDPATTTVGVSFYATAGTNGFAIALATPENFTCSFDILSPNEARYTILHNVQSASTTNWNAVASASTHMVATAYTGMQFNIVSGTITGGTIKVYGYK